MCEWSMFSGNVGLRSANPTYATEVAAGAGSHEVGRRGKQIPRFARNDHIGALLGMQRERGGMATKTKKDTGFPIRSSIKNVKDKRRE